MYWTVILVCLIAACNVSGDPLVVENNVEPHIVGGWDAEIEDYPYQVSLRYADSHMCGASIINVNWTLSAAHCVIEVDVTSRYSIRAGSSFVSSGGAMHEVDRVIRHHMYDAKTFDYDFALFKVSTPFEYSLQIAAIALPFQGQVTADDSVTVISGWGTIWDGGPLPAQLQEVEVQVVSAGVCGISYAGVTDRMICASSPGQDSCQGDAGGPMVFNNTLVGVGSFAKGCALQYDPGVYAKVSSVRDWIDASMDVSYSVAAPVDAAVVLVYLCLATSFVSR